MKAGCSGGGEIGGEKLGELKPDGSPPPPPPPPPYGPPCGGGDATKLGVVLPDPKNMSLEGVPRAEDAAGL